MASDSSDDREENWMWVGCVFAPTDEELIDLFLLKKVRNLPLVSPPDFSIPELEVYERPPWELVVSSSYHLAGVFYCFARVPRSKARDNRLKRKTRGGTWVANGKPRNIAHRDRRAAIVGTRTSLKFFKDSDDPRTKKMKDRRLGTEWIMHEYRLHPSLYATIPSYETQEIILCRIRHKGKGLAPKAPPLAHLSEPSMAAPATQDRAVDVPGCSGVHGTGAAEDESWMARPAIQGMAVDVPGCFWVHGTAAMEEELRMPAAATQDAMADALVCCRAPCTRALGKQPWDSAAMIQAEEEAWTSDEMHELHKLLEVLDDLPAEATAPAETAVAPPVAEPPKAALETQSAGPGCPPPRHTGAMEEEPASAGFDAATDFLPAEDDKSVDLDIDELLGEFPVSAPPATELSMDPATSIFFWF